MGWAWRLSQMKWAVKVLLRELPKANSPGERSRWLRYWLEAAEEARFQAHLGELVPSVAWEQFRGACPESLIHCLHESTPLIADQFKGESFSLLFPRELFILSALTRALAPRKMFEFGSARGGTAVNLLQNAPADSTLFTLDRTPMPDSVAELSLMIAQGRLIPLIGDSRTMSLESHYGTCDLVFVDGGHEEATVRSDSQKALSLVSDRGIIVWHDFHPRWPGVVNVISELAKTKPLRRISGTRLVYHSLRATQRSFSC